MGYFSEMKDEVQQFAEVISQALLVESELFGYEEGSFTGAKKGGKKLS